MLDADTHRATGPWVVFGGAENVTVAGKVFPVPPDRIVTPSPGNATYEQEEPVVVTSKLAVPPFAGSVSGDLRERVRTQGFPGCQNPSG